jgi:hypothetical protein
MTRNCIAAALMGITLGLAPSPSVAQSAPTQPTLEQVVFTPLLGFKGGAVGGRARGTVKPATPLPSIDIIAPGEYSGLTTSATPSLYFYVSRRVSYPTRFTISAPRQPAPVIETSIPSPDAAGIYAIRLADHRVRLESGTIYTWSISIILDAKAPSRDIVASASLVRVPLDPNLDAALRVVPAPRRVGLLASAGLWYDAVAEAVDLNQRAALDAMMNQIGLVEVARYDLQTTRYSLDSVVSPKAAIRHANLLRVPRKFHRPYRNNGQ